ncbi:hypothetical protein J1N35_034028 [Gossypium stocksii]|uniref:Uncharacterized protein n=1 Tax=Gossypium stocksii TaxID=47602 RepID=A0A9D3URD2_9ROSI|nr:hypothetical protein J1N35_034028 [Gossypium stocksii]
MEEGVSNPIDIVANIGVGVEVEVTTDIELESFLVERLNKSIDFLALVGEMLTKENDEFIVILI